MVAQSGDVEEEFTARGDGDGGKAEDSGVQVTLSIRGGVQVWKPGQVKQRTNTSTGVNSRLC